MIFDKDKKRIATKAACADMLKKGQIMRLTADLETGGFPRSDVPYGTPASTFITEWGDCLTDFAGNYLNSMQVFPRKREGDIPQPGAMTLQHMTPHDLENPDLDPYGVAIAKVLWRIEQAKTAYDQMASADEREFIHGVNINKAMTAVSEENPIPGQRDFAEQVIPIPLIDDTTGEITYDFRWHPTRQKVSYRMDSDHFEDNIMYVDDEDGSRWKWVDPTLAIRFFNAPYDIPIFRNAIMQLGFDGSDATFMYSKATLTNSQNKKNYLGDTRHFVYATALYGPQGEDGLKLGEIEDPITGKIRRSESQVAIMEKAMKHFNGIRMIGGGPFNLHDGSFADLAKAHGAHVDAIMTAGLENASMDAAPWLYGNNVRQTDENYLTKHFFSRKPDANGKTMDVYSLPRKVAGISHGESMYRFLDTDDQMGRFKRLVFLHTDGTFHKGEDHEGKAFKDMNKDEWVTYFSMKHVKGDPDRPVRVESVRRFPNTAVHIDDVFKRTSMGKRYRSKLSDIERDLKYIDENPIMQENIRAAQAEIQRNMRYNAHDPQVKTKEDEFPHLFAGECPYIDDPESIKDMDGARIPHPIVKMVKGRHDDVFKFMAETDRSLNQLAIKIHMIDAYKDYYAGDELGLYDGALSRSTQIDTHFENGVELGDQDDPDQNKAQQAFDKLKKDVETAYAQRTKAAGDARTLFDDMKDPNTGKSFFDEDGTLKISTLEDAYHLRNIIRMQVSMARNVTQNFQTLAQDIYDKKFTKKKYPYKDIMDEMTRPKKRGVKAESYFQTPEGRGTKKKISFASPRDALDFRLQIGRRLMDDYLGELSKENSTYAEGKIDKTWCMKPKGNQKHRLLFANVDNGEKGGTPYIADEHGRELSASYLKGMEEKYVLQKLKSGEWKETFHRLGSDPSMSILVNRWVEDYDMADDIPEFLYEYMYKTDLMEDLWGEPNETPETARNTTLETVDFELTRLEMAASTRTPGLLEKAESPLFAEAAKTLQFEEGQRGAAQYRQWLEGMKEKYPKPRFDSAPELIAASRHDPESGLPFDYIDQKITRDTTKNFMDDGNFVVVDVPTQHLRYPVETFEKDLPHKGIVIPNLDKATKTAIKRGKSVVFREIETGRIYAGGENSVHDIPAKDQNKYSTIVQKVHNDYGNAGSPISDDTTLSYIGIEGMRPLANTRKIDPDVQAFKLPSAQFDALTFPQFTAFGNTPLTTVILPVDYCPQKLEPGKLLRLRDTIGDVFSNMGGTVNDETGHIYDTTLISVDGMDGTGKVVGKTIEEIRDYFRDNQNAQVQKVLEGSGFVGVDHLYSKLNQWRADGFKPHDERILVAHFATVNEHFFKNGRDEQHNMWGMFNALSAPEASFAINGKHPSPSIYRDNGWTPDIDGA